MHMSSLQLCCLYCRNMLITAEMNATFDLWPLIFHWSHDFHGLWVCAVCVSSFFISSSCYDIFNPNSVRKHFQVKRHGLHHTVVSSAADSDSLPKNRMGDEQASQNLTAEPGYPCHESLPNNADCTATYRPNYLRWAISQISAIKPSKTNQNISIFVINTMPMIF